MAGIQYSTARTDATHAEATDDFPSPSSLRAKRAPRRRTIPSLRRLSPERSPISDQQQPRQPRKPRRQVNSLTWRAREALRHRCDAEEEPMSDLAARFVYSPLLSTAFTVLRVGFGALDSDHLSNDVLHFHERHSPRRRHEFEDRPRR
jgi:hypothetical protein